MPIPISDAQEPFREFVSGTREHWAGTCGHSQPHGRRAHQLLTPDAATIAEWKDGLNEAWAESLLELIDTRTQILAAHELHKFYHDAKEIFGRIQDKHKKLPEELGEIRTQWRPYREWSTLSTTSRLLGTQVGGAPPWAGRRFSFHRAVFVPLSTSLSTPWLLTACLREWPKLKCTYVCTHTLGHYFNALQFRRPTSP